MHKVLVTVRIFANLSSNPAYDILKDKGIELVPNPYKGKGLSEDELMELIPGVHGLLTGVDQVTAKFIQASDKLRVISKFGTGVDNIDIKAATEKGIIVTKAPGMNSDSVADMAFALLFAIARRVPYASDKVKNGEWPLILGTEIWGKTLGIIGLGEIGKRVALRAKGFNMRVSVYEIEPDEEFIEDHKLEVVDLNRLLQESDFVSIHTPLLDDTRDLIGKKEIQRMKPDAFLINTARGGIVNEDALYDALTSGVIAGAAFDVLKDEPPADRKLIGLENFVGTPHISAFTKEAINNMARISAQNVVDVLEGKIPPFVANKEVLNRPNATV